MKPTVLASSLIVFFVAAPPLRAADVIYVRAHEAAMEASDTCQRAWTGKTREETLKTIQDRGSFMASILNPLHRDSERHYEMLSEVTDAMRDCGILIFGD